jgi:cell division protein FtsL
MKNFQQKRILQRVIHSWPVLIFLSFLVLFFAWGMIGFIGKMMETRENRQIIESKVKELQQDKEKLTSDMVKLSTEEGREESIREKFGLAKEGEGMIVIIEDKDSVLVEDDKGGGFFDFLRNWFK